MITPTQKQDLIKKFRIHPNDTGSPEVQVAILTERISVLSEHLKSHKKDKHSRRSLIEIVAKRKSLLDYLARKDATRCKNLTQTLQLRTS